MKSFGMQKGDRPKGLGLNVYMNGDFIVFFHVRIWYWADRRHLFPIHSRTRDVSTTIQKIWFFIFHITFLFFFSVIQFNVGQMMVDSTGMRTENIKPGTPITSETSSSKNTNDSSSGNAKNSSATVEKIVPSR